MVRFRALGTLASHGIVERGNQMSKRPICWAGNCREPGHVSVFHGDFEVVSDADRAPNDVRDKGNASPATPDNELSKAPRDAGETFLIDELRGEAGSETLPTFALDGGMGLFGEPKDLYSNRRKPDIRVWNMGEVWLDGRNFNSDDFSASPRDVNGRTDMGG